MGSNGHKVTVVIPAKDEEGTIRHVVDSVRPYCDDVLVVVAKNCSDRTLQVVESMKVSYIIDDGMGHGRAKRLAINHVDNGILVFFDADGSHEPRDIPKMIQPIRNGKADMVIGSRLRGGSDELHGTFSNILRMFGSQIIQLAINYRYGVRLSDCVDGFRALRTSIAKTLPLTANDFDIEQEMVAKALKMKFKVDEVPTHEYERRQGQSKINLLRMGWKFAWRLLKDIL